MQIEIIDIAVKKHQDVASLSHTTDYSITKVSESEDEEYFDDNDLEYDDDEDDDDYYDDDYNEDSDGYEEEQECLRAFYNMRNKPKPIFSPQKQEALKERQQNIRQKKKEKEEQEQQLVQEVFDIKDASPDETLSFSKGKKLASSSTGVKGFCYVPQQNLIFVIMEDARNALVYSSLNFKLVKQLKFARTICMVRYLAEHARVFFGGKDFFIQTFNLHTFQTGIRTDLFPGEHIDEIAHLKKNAIAVSTVRRDLHIMSASLNVLYIFSNYCSGSIKDIISLSNNFVLTSSSDNIEKKNLVVCDIKTKEPHWCDISVLPNSCLELTRKGNMKTVTCLAIIPGSPTFRYAAPLVQLAWDPKKCNMIVHRIGPEDKMFTKLEKIQNSDYFAAIQHENSPSEIVLLKIFGDDFQMIKTLVQNDCDIAYQKMPVWLQHPSLMIGTDRLGSVYVCSAVHKKSSNKELEN